MDHLRDLLERLDDLPEGERERAIAWLRFIVAYYRQIDAEGES